MFKNYDLTINKLANVHNNLMITLNIMGMISIDGAVGGCWWLLVVFVVMMVVGAVGGVVGGVGIFGGARVCNTFDRNVGSATRSVSANRFSYPPIPSAADPALQTALHGLELQTWNKQTEASTSCKPSA